MKFIEAVDPAHRARRIAKLAKRGEHHAKMHDEFKRKADQQDQRLGRALFAGGGMTVIDDKGVHKANPSPYDKQKADKERRSAAHLVKDYDANAYTHTLAHSKIQGIVRRFTPGASDNDRRLGKQSAAFSRYFAAIRKHGSKASQDADSIVADRDRVLKRITKKK